MVSGKRGFDNRPDGDRSPLAEMVPHLRVTARRRVKLGTHEDEIMKPPLTALIDNSKLNCLLLPEATEKLRKTMCEIGSAVALEPTFGPKTEANGGTFQKLFGHLELDSKLLGVPAAVEGFRAGVRAVPIL
jgi:hypothetical protein